MDNNFNLIGDYQRYLMMLNELAKEENTQKMNDFLAWLASNNLPAPDKDVTPESLAKMDFALFQLRSNELERFFPEIKEQIDQKVLCFDPFVPLYDAGFGSEDIGKMPIGFLNDIQTTMAFESEFPEENKKPLAERLKESKSTFIKMLKSDAAKLTMSTVMFGIAVGTGGGAALAVSSAMFATKLMENKSVQGLLSRVEGKVDQFLIDNGYKKEVVEERKQTFGEKLEGITNSKWYKMLKVPVAACLILSGVGAAAAVGLSSMGVDSLADVAELAGKGSDYISGLNVGELADKGSQLISQVSDSFDLNVGSQLPGVDSPAFVPNHDGITELTGHANIGDSQVISEHVDFATADFSTTNEFTFNSEGVDGSLDVLDGKTEGAYSGYDSGMDELSIEGDLPVASEYTAKSGDTLWELAKEHYLAQTGHEPTGQQIVAMINDLGLDDPNSIGVNETFSFENDVSKYDDIKMVTADWLENGTEHAAHVASTVNDNAVHAASIASDKADTLLSASKQEIGEPFIKNQEAATRFMKKVIDKDIAPSI
ncbi:hypothetical protein D3C79_86670 [compost metagenome]